MQNGFYTSAIGVDVWFNLANQVMDGWNRSAGGYDVWGVDGECDYYGSANNADNIITKRGAFNHGSIFTYRAQAPGQIITWKSCYFYTTGSFNCDGNTSGLDFVWQGCTFKGPLFDFQYDGNVVCDCFFYDCLFDETVFYTNYTDQRDVYFYRCWFTKSKAEVIAGVREGHYHFVDCHFGVSLPNPLPTDITTISLDTLRYDFFGLPDSSHPDWSANDYDYGFELTPRRGPGAFYFASPSYSIDATPESGNGPLTVDFSFDKGGGIDQPVGFDWDFGDGESSHESSPSHQYTLPGEWYPSVTVTFVSGYTITLYGDPIYVYDVDYSPGEPNPTRTNTCYRTPIRGGDGYGCSEYGDSENVGFDWLWPAARVGTCVVYDTLGREMALVWDAKTQRIYRINDKRVWRDRTTDYGGIRIDSWFHHKADYAVKGEHVAIVHEETHNYFKPYDKLKAGTSGYDSKGYPTGMVVDQRINVNEEQEYTAETKNIPKDGDIVYQEHVEGRSIQNRVIIRGAPWWYTGFQWNVTSIDKAARPSLREMTEDGWLEALTSLPLFHVSRSHRGTINLATGEAPAGTVDTRPEGPDGRDSSAMAFVTGNTGLSDTLSASLDGDFTLSLWYKAADSLLPVTLWTIGAAFEVRIVIAGGVRMLTINDGVNPALAVALNGNGVGWEQISIVRDGLYLRVYEGESMLGSYPLATAENYGAVLGRCGGDGMDVFDAWIVPRAVESEAIAYYNDNVLRGGIQVLPEY
jgi:PKD repeat protein